MFDRSAQLLGIETSKPRSVRATLGRLWRYFRLYLLALAVVLIAALASTYMQVLIPDLIGQAVDCFIGPFTAREFIAESTPGLPAGAPGFQDSAFGNCWYADSDQALSAGDTIGELGKLVLFIAALYFGSSLLSGGMFFMMSWAGFHVLRDF